jgi:hypothetical protein
MSVTNGPNLGVMIDALTGDNFDADFRRFLRMGDSLTMPVVINHTLSAPPGSPANGDRYVVAAGASGAWSGHSGSIATWTMNDPANPSGIWEFRAPQSGWIVFTRAGSPMPIAWNGSAWIPIAAGFVPTYTVAGLPAGSAAMVAYASDGRKVGEGAGAGTGVPCYFSGAQWRRYSDDSVVAA